MLPINLEARKDMNKGKTGSGKEKQVNRPHGNKIIR